MTRCINKIQLIIFTVSGAIIESDTLRLDGDPTLFFYVHGIKHLLGHFALGQTATKLYEAIGNSRFSVVYVGNNGKIPNMTQVTHAGNLLILKKAQVYRNWAST